MKVYYTPYEGGYMRPLIISGSEKEAIAELITNRRKDYHCHARTLGFEYTGWGSSVSGTQVHSVLFLDDQGDGKIMWDASFGMDRLEWAEKNSTVNYKGPYPAHDQLSRTDQLWEIAEIAVKEQRMSKTMMKRRLGVTIFRTQEIMEALIDACIIDEKRNVLVSELDQLKWW